ncbi:MAG TPA: chemotaxis protein CheA [Oligoflexus sp.]|uniref:chemotaxis protein CheA n=1 Tax=Oligoflexus sp. TaxID=1971216 RepID=UPI002D4E99DE|nr:chemotaxis protein CheA [Oligoflexus sp.]HYX38845.1 chemotaxis protein CheA [Oligoflexus sp.]
MSEDTDFLAKVRFEFLQEARDLLDSCEEVFLGLDTSINRENCLAEVFRAIHTIKGSGAAVGFVSLVEFAHAFEDCLAALRTYPDRLTFELTSLLLACLDAMRTKIQMLSEGKDDNVPTPELEQKLGLARDLIVKKAGPKAQPVHQAFGFFEDDEDPAHGSVATSTSKASVPGPADDNHAARRDCGSIKVDSSRIDSVLDLVGELVVLKSQLINKTEPYVFDTSLGAVVSLLDKTIRELQDKALAIRMMPIKPLFMKMQRMARDLSVKTGKAVEFEMDGEDTELDRMVVESLSDPLLHLVRNAIDHGLENAGERQKSGKVEPGRIQLTACQSSGRIIVRITDNGRGIRRDVVVKKAIEKGLVQPDVKPENLSDHDVFSLLLAPGFSTAEKVTDISGRGVGLDVVHSQIEKLRGSLLIKSEEGQGSSFEISLPLTASVTEGMIVEIAKQMVVLPMDRIRELVKIESHSIVEIRAGQAVLNVRGQMLPMVDPLALLSPHSAGLHVTGKLAVVLEHQDRLYALVIGSVVGQMQVIMKPMNAALPHDVIAGVTILGDGQVALIADVEGLVQTFLRSGQPRTSERMMA